MDTAAEEVGLQELKQSAQMYYSCSGNGAGVVEKMEDILNKIFYDRPSDVFKHLARYFEKFSRPPVLSKLYGRDVPDSRGVLTVQLDVYCESNGSDEVIVELVAPSSYDPDNIALEDRERVEAENAKSIESAIELIGGSLTALLRGQVTADQNTIDRCISDTFSSLQAGQESKNPSKEQVDVQVAEEETRSDSPKAKGKPAKGSKSKVAVAAVVPEEPPEQFVNGCEAASAVSMAVCKSAALIRGKPLYEHIAECMSCEHHETFRLPLPLVTIMSCGKAGSGKLRCVREFMVVPSPAMPLHKAVKCLYKIFNYCAKNMGGKNVPPPSSRSTNDLGALLCPPYDRPEQGLDLLQEAITAAGLVPGTDFHLAINCAGHDIFDYEKGKYEIATGQFKSGDELAKYWIELTAKYPSLILLIDPLRKQEKESWMQLVEAVSSRCYVTGDHVYHRPGRLRNEELPVDFKSSAIVLCLHHINTVTDVLVCAKKMNENGCDVVIGCSPGETNESFVADLAVGCHARFLKLGGLCRGERAAKLHRLLDIERDLESRGQLRQESSHTFVQIKLQPVEQSKDGPAVINEVSSRHAARSPSPDKKLSPSADKKPAKKSK